VTPRQWPNSPDVAPNVEHNGGPGFEPDAQLGPPTAFLPAVEPPGPEPVEPPNNRPSPVVLAAIAAGALAVFGIFALLLPSLIGGSSPSGGTSTVQNAAPPPPVTQAPTETPPSAAVATPSATAPPSTATTTAAAVAGNARFEQQVLGLVNAERRRGHCQPVRMDDKLRAAARAHSADMATNNFVDHTGSDGSSPADRMRKAGYPQALSENLARGPGSPQAVVRAWMHDRSDRANILDCDARAMGVGVSFRGRTPFWTQDFGRA
jgi:uncharacterized protein YkwD